MTPRSLFLFLSFFITCSLVNSQQEAAIWYFGENAGLDFRSGTPVPLLDGALDTLEGCATISDFNGNLLFYTDGITVWNRNHAPMPNGTGLLGHYSSTQSAIMVPHPGNADQYYIFTADHAKLPDGINYSLVDMTLDGGLGDITQKNVQLLTPAAEKLTAVRHANGTDIWVLIRDAYADAFSAYRIGPAGVDVNPVITNIGVNLTTYFFESLGHAGGYMKASPDGTKLAVSNSGLSLELFDFDTATGVLSNARHLLPLNEVWKQFYGVEFSPSSRFLYACSNSMGEIIQYDTEAADIMASKVVLSTRPDLVGAMQLGIDGRIYMNDFDRETNSNITTLSVIENPNEQGAACNLVYNAIDLGGRRANQGLPPFITSFFQVDIEVDGLCEGSPTTFNSTISDTPISTVWDFGDGNTSNLENPVHTYATAGSYTVSVTVTTASEVRTETKDITIFETPVAFSPGDTESCIAQESYSIDLSSYNSTVLGAQDPNDFTVNYFLSQTAADSNTGSLSTTHDFPMGNTAVYTRVSNRGNPACYATAQFNVISRQAPVFGEITNWTVCDDDTDGLYTFILSSKDPEIFNGQDETSFEILYFSSQAAADAGTNPLPTMYTNTLAREELFVRFQNIAYPDCYRTESFMIEVSSGVVANTPTDLQICDDDNDGFFGFDLSVKETEIIGTQNPGGLDISYHRTSGDADSGANLLTTTYTNADAYEQIIYVRVQNSLDTSCYATTLFTLRVADTPQRQSVTDWTVCDNDNDGLYQFDLSEKNSEILGSQNETDFTISYHTNPTDAELDQNPIVGNYQNMSAQQELYYRMESVLNPSCFITDSFQLAVFNTPFAVRPAPIVECEINGTLNHTIDLTERNTEILGIQEAAQFDVFYYATEVDAQNNNNRLDAATYGPSSNEETLYARVSPIHLGTCYAITPVQLSINPLLLLPLENRYVICPDSPSLSIDGGDFETWSWRSAQGSELSDSRVFDVAEIGVYSLTVSRTQNGISCDNTATFEVLSSGAPESMEVSINGFSDQVNVRVSATGTGPFEYSLDGENFQLSNAFTVLPGAYTAYVRDVLECRLLTEEIVAIGYQRFFTPNGDGSNEFWNIIGTELYPEAQLFIFDRYGKLLAEVPPNSQGWDGTMNGTPLPASDYWFQYVYADQEVITGHFSLKR